LGGNLGGEEFILLLDGLLDGFSKIFDIFIEFINCTLSNDGCFSSLGLFTSLASVCLKNFCFRMSLGNLELQVFLGSDNLGLGS
jgi:hypothetical protein